MAVDFSQIMKLPVPSPLGEPRTDATDAGYLGWGAGDGGYTTASFGEGMGSCSRFSFGAVFPINSSDKQWLTPVIAKPDFDLQGFSCID